MIHTIITLILLYTNGGASPSSAEMAPCEMASSFGFPLGGMDAKAYYNAQKFGENYHLGEDWNGVLGGNTDYGDAVYAIASGFIHTVKDFGGGWGKVMRISHHYELNGDTLFVESLYAHLNTFERNEGQCVNKGDLIGTIGDAGGQ